MANDEYYTPIKYIKLVRKTLGTIDLDPASCKFANQYLVGASQYFSIADNGLRQDWKAKNIFLNFPYSHSSSWMNKVYCEFDKENFANIIILSNVVTDVAWFHRLKQLNKNICLLFEDIEYREKESFFSISFVEKRINFIDQNGIEKTQGFYPSMFICITRDQEIFEKFEMEFSEIGTVLK